MYRSTAISNMGHGSTVEEANQRIAMFKRKNESLKKENEMLRKEINVMKAHSKKSNSRMLNSSHISSQNKNNEEVNRLTREVAKLKGYQREVKLIK